MERAIAIGEYFIPHARAVLLELGSDPDVKRARKALDWIRAGRLAAFSKRELHKTVANNAPAGAADAEVSRVIGLLQEHNIVRRGEPKPGAIPTFEVNPKILGPESNAS